MRILLSNDDGFLAPGIRVLAKELKKVAEVVTVAPDRNRSGVSNSLTLDRPVRAQEHGANEFSVSGTPTDCVHLAVTGMLQQQPDMVVSGINDGSNLSDDVIYSGTVAAAVEGRFLGLPAIAVSLVGGSCEHYDTAAVIVRQIIEQLTISPLSRDTILNINVPDLPLDQIKGIRATRLGKRHMAQPTVKAVDPRGKTVYWVGLPGKVQDAGPGTDFSAVEAGYVSITPLQLDLTNYEKMREIEPWAKNFSKTFFDSE